MVLEVVVLVEIIFLEEEQQELQTPVVVEVGKVLLEVQVLVVQV